MKAPIAAKKEHIQKIHGVEWNDSYFWLREKENPEVLNHLRAENSYSEFQLRDQQPLIDKLYNEMVGRVPAKDSTVPAKSGNYHYYTKYIDGKDYPIYCRTNPHNQEETLLDLNQLSAEGAKSFINLGGYSWSQSHRYLAYAIDRDGSETYTLYIKDLETSEITATGISNSSGSLAWSKQDDYLFYGILNHQHRPHQILRHKLGSAIAKDEVIYTEHSPKFFISVYESLSRDYLFISTGSEETSEYHYLPTAAPLSPLKVVMARRENIDYSVYHHQDDFYIKTNEDAKDFKVMKTKITNIANNAFIEVVPHKSGRMLMSMLCFQDYIAIVFIENAQEQFLILDLKNNSNHVIKFPDPAYSAALSTNHEYPSQTLRLSYSSLISPEVIYDYDLLNRKLIERKTQMIPSGYDKNDYASERIFATSHDGKKIPISLVYRKNLPRNGKSPLFLRGYGAYGINSHPRFNRDIFSLLDRGFIYGIAHIRGSTELGRQWHDDGKLMNKKNTFDDYISCVEHLITEKYTSKGNICAWGGSAGGMLMGAIANSHPHYFKVILAVVPFVDCLNTMLDATLPLTPIEYDQWGNPNEKTYFDYIRSYSPYDNVRRQEYPHMLVISGLNDQRVTYWEPTKWVARLREMKTDNNLLMLITHMEEGHFGAKGRFSHLRETAKEFGFILKCFDIKE